MSFPRISRPLARIWSSLSRPRRPRFVHRPMLEVLEDRTVLSTLSIDSSGNLLYSATAGHNNTVTLSRQTTFTILSDSGEIITLDSSASAKGWGSTGHAALGPTTSITAITLNLADGADHTSIQSIGRPTTYRGNGSADFVDVGKAGSLLSINATVSLVNNTSATTLTINDSADASIRTPTLSSSSLVDLGPADFNFDGSNLLALNILAGTAGNSFTIASTGTKPITLSTGTGSDTVNVQATNGPIEIKGQNGTDTINLGTSSRLVNLLGAITVGNALGLSKIAGDDSLDLTARTVTVSNTAVTGLAPAAIGYSATDQVALKLLAGQGADTFTITGTPAGSSSIDGGAGADKYNVQGTNGALSLLGNNNPDTVTIGSLAPTLGGTVAGILGDVSLADSSKDMTVVVDDSGDASARTVTFANSGIIAQELTGLAPGPIDLQSGVSKFTVNGGGGNDTIALNALNQSGTTAYNGGGGDDQFNFGTETTFVTGTKALTVHGEAGVDSLNITDHASGLGISYTVKSTSIDRGGAATINFATMEGVFLSTGPSNDVITLASTPPASTPLTINGLGTDSLIGKNSANTWNITAGNAGTVGSVTFRFISNLTGGTASDTFKFSPGATLSGSLDGGSGVDLLDYSLFTSAIAVDLTNGSATAVGSVSHIENVNGGSGNDTITGDDFDNILKGGKGGDILHGNGGNDILVGADDNDTLDGGLGRDILIGGLGIDTVLGSSDDYIIIGGRTTYDNNNASLDKLRQEWARTDADYATRIGHLRTGGGLNGTVLLDATKVLNDSGAADTLTGNTELDWFWQFAGDTITDLNGGGTEQVN